MRGHRGFPYKKFFSFFFVLFSSNPWICFFFLFNLLNPSRVCRGGSASSPALVLLTLEENLLNQGVYNKAIIFQPEQMY